MESLKRQLADARAGEDKQRAEVQVAHRQTDAVAQLRGMQERLDALEVCAAFLPSQKSISVSSRPHNLLAGLEAPKLTVQGA